MSPVEGINQLIAVADRFDSIMADAQSAEELKFHEDTKLAVAISQAMLNAALPVARFRCFVSVDRDSKKKGPIRDEFTISATNISAILGGLIGISQYQTDVHVTLWEQRATGADMISGYQGPTKVQRYRKWLESLPSHEAHPTAQ